MEEIINSVMQSPENTNPNVLRSQLQKMSTGGEVGYTVEEARTELFTETATGTEVDGYYVAELQAEAFDADSVVVTFNGTEYTCEKIIGHAYDDEQGVPTIWCYGANVFIEMGDTIDFSKFPFSLTVADGTGTMLYTTTAGPNTIKVETVSETVTPTDEFKAAVNASIEGGSGGRVIEVEAQYDNEEMFFVVNMTPTELLAAMKNGASILVTDSLSGGAGILIVRYYFNGYMVTSSTEVFSIYCITAVSDGYSDRMIGVQNDLGTVTFQAVGG